MKAVFVIGISTLAMIAGVIAAILWARSTKTDELVEKLLGGLMDGKTVANSPHVDIGKIRMAAILANQDNRRAAGWTATAVILSALANIVGAL